MSSKVLLLLDSSNFGGIESHVFEMAKGLHQLGERVTVVFMRDCSQHPLHTKLNQSGIHHCAVTGLSSLIQLLTQVRPHVLHTHGYRAGIVGRLAAQITHVSAVSTFHAGETLSGKLALYDWLDRNTAFLAKRVFSVSNTISEHVHAPNTVMNNFIDTGNLSMSQGCQTAFVGRLSHEKGPDLLVDIAAYDSNNTYHVYGDGPLLASLRSHAPSNIHFQGQTQNMDSAWRHIGLLLITSRQEGLPMAAIEAMARGIPVIAFNVGQLHTLIDHNDNGWLIEPGRLTQFKKAIQSWHALSPEKQMAIRESAMKKVQSKFSTNVVIPQYQSTYHALQCAQ